MSWPTFWQTTQWQTQLLKPLSALVCLVAARRLAKFEQTPPAKTTQAVVIVVGNIVVGGSGKTPFILWLAKALRQANLSYGIVSRGYGGKSDHWPRRVTADSNPADVGDEPVLLAKTLNCPIAVAPKRVAAIASLAEENLDVIISDDGLQHYAMARDLEIVLMDAQRGLGNGLCLPAGPLREPACRLQKVDFVIWNGGQAADQLNMQLLPVCFRKVKQPTKTLPVEAFAGQTVQAIAGIGNPERFFETLRALAILVEGKSFSDHRAYRQTDFALFDSQKPLLLTQKDAVKCTEFAKDNWWYLEISPQCPPQLADELIKRIKNGS